MAKSSVKQKAPLVKKKLGPALGFRTNDYFRSTKFGKGPGKFQTRQNPSQFITQHKGG